MDHLKVARLYKATNKFPLVSHVTRRPLANVDFINNDQNINFATLDYVLDVWATRAAYI